MSFDVGTAVGAGLIAGAVMSVLLYMGIAMMPRQMKMNLFLMLGTMMVGNKALVSTPRNNRGQQQAHGLRGWGSAVSGVSRDPSGW